MSPFEMLPPNRSNTESETAVESRRKTALTFIFSLKTSQGYGILDSRALTEFLGNKNTKQLKQNKQNKIPCTHFGSENYDKKHNKKVKELTEYRSTWPSSMVFSENDFSLCCICSYISTHGNYTKIS